MTSNERAMRLARQWKMQVNNWLPFLSAYPTLSSVALSCLGPLQD